MPGKHDLSPLHLSTLQQKGNQNNPKIWQQALKNFYERHGPDANDMGVRPFDFETDYLRPDRQLNILAYSILWRNYDIKFIGEKQDRNVLETILWTPLILAAFKWPMCLNKILFETWNNSDNYMKCTGEAAEEMLLFQQWAIKWTSERVISCVNGDTNANDFNFIYDWYEHLHKIYDSDENIKISLVRQDLFVADLAAIKIYQDLKLQLNHFFDAWHTNYNKGVGFLSLYQQACNFDIIEEKIPNYMYLIDWSKNADYFKILCKKVENNDKILKTYILDSMSSKPIDSIVCDDSTMVYIDECPEFIWKVIAQSDERPINGDDDEWFYLHGVNARHSQVIAFCSNKVFHAKTQTLGFVAHEPGNEKDSLTLVHIGDPVIIQQPPLVEQNEEHSPPSSLWGKTLNITGFVRESGIRVSQINNDILFLFDVDSVLVFLKPKYIKLSLQTNVTDRMYVYLNNPIVKTRVGIKKQYFDRAGMEGRLTVKLDPPSPPTA